MGGKSYVKIIATNAVDVMKKIWLSQNFTVSPRNNFFLLNWKCILSYEVRFTVKKLSLLFLDIQCFLLLKGFPAIDLLGNNKND